MNLRQWQSDCISQAIEKYCSGQQHFLCLATPGAGKTLMAAKLAKTLFDKGMIDLVICFSPSVLVSQDFQEALERHTQMRMDGQMGSKGASITYQSMVNLSDKFWTLLNENKVFVIFDEIHHCSAPGEKHANAWGQQIIEHIQGKAAFTLALTGTPWRSDKTPIVLARYCQNNRVSCDFAYGLNEAINDQVCRTPLITLVENDNILFIHDENEKRYESISQLLNNSECSYQQLIENDQLIIYLLKQSVTQLNTVRQADPSAGGLIVASSVEHAQKIAGLMRRVFGEQPVIATYADSDARQTIQNFRRSSEKWIISVGMISEGTNIPRLRVCCHLTRIKTELHFRQVLGRILRQNEHAGYGYLYMPAEPNLVEYAKRIAEEVPSSHVATFEVMKQSRLKEPIAIRTKPLPNAPATKLSFWNEQSFGANTTSEVTPSRTSNLASKYESSVNIFGRFRSELIGFPVCG